MTNTPEPLIAELLRVHGREAVAGPLQEAVEVVVQPSGVVLSRGRILRPSVGTRRKGDALLPYRACH